MQTILIGWRLLLYFLDICLSPMNNSQDWVNEGEPNIKKKPSTNRWWCWSETQRDRDRDRDRQIDRQTGRQTDRHGKVDRQTDRHGKTDTGKEKDRQTETEAELKKANPTNNWLTLCASASCHSLPGDTAISAFGIIRRNTTDFPATKLPGLLGDYTMAGFL